MGYGIVVGLDGTGDSSLAVTLQSMQSTISQLEWYRCEAEWKFCCSYDYCRFDPFTKVGQKIGVTVSSMGKAKSLRGGTLLMTLKGADGKIMLLHKETLR